MQIQEKSFLLVLEINFPEKKRKTLCYGSDQKKILTCREVFLSKKDAFHNTDFSRLKCQLKRKKKHCKFQASW